jgi:hypothetical protein
VNSASQLRRFIDPASLVVILITLILFVVAVITKGFTHDLLLEAGVFLVSVKLILMSHKNGMTELRITEQLQRIERSIDELRRSN